MSNYVPRLEAPDVDDLNWINTNYGGNNPCLVIYTDTGLVLPNCVGYTWGRWYELLGVHHNLYTGNAEGAYYYDDGYNRGQDPKLGAVICFSRTGGGHTAVVEKIIDSTHIITSNSAYDGPYFWTETVTKINGVWTRPVIGYTFQGFIYIPKNFSSIPIWMLYKFNRRNNYG